MDPYPTSSVDARAGDLPPHVAQSMFDVDAWSAEIEAFVGEVSNELSEIVRALGGQLNQPTGAISNSDLNSDRPAESVVEHAIPVSATGSAAANPADQDRFSSSRLQQLKQRLANLHPGDNAPPQPGRDTFTVGNDDE